MPASARSRLTKRTVNVHAATWAGVTVGLFIAYIGPGAASNFMSGDATVRDLAVGLVWVGLWFLIPGAVIATVLWGIDVGLLLALRNVTAFGRVGRALLPAIAVVVAAALMFSAGVAVTFYSLNGRGAYFAAAMGAAAAVGALVFWSHMRFSSRYEAAGEP